MYSVEDINRMIDYVQLEQDEVVFARVLEVEIIPGYKNKGKQFNMSFEALKGFREGSIFPVRYIQPPIVVTWMRNYIEMSIEEICDLMNRGMGMRKLIGREVKIIANRPNEKGYTRIGKLTNF